MKYIVFTEIIYRNHKPIERWYYGTWADRDRANEVALELGIQYEEEYTCYHCVCEAEKAVAWGVNNLPN